MWTLIQDNYSNIIFVMCPFISVLINNFENSCALIGGPSRLGSKAMLNESIDHEK